MASELGKPEAYEFFRCSAYMDISDFKHNTADGLHLACLGGVWMCVVNGFLGMRHYKDGIHFEPHIPSEWESYDCNICYHGAVIGIEVGKAEAVFTLKSGDEVEFFLNGEKKRLTASDNKCECPVR